jgi:hypothetical protein
MRFFFSFILFSFFVLQISAQPLTEKEKEALFAEKRDAVVLIKAYGQGQNVIGTSSGFFIESHGVLITTYSSISRASQVMVVTRDNHLFEIDQVLEEYEKADLVKFSIKNPDNFVFPTIRFSESILYEGDEAFALGINDKNTAEPTNGLVSIVRMFEGVGPGLLLMMPVGEVHDGAPLLDARGELIGVISYAAIEKFDRNIAISILALDHHEIEEKKEKEIIDKQKELTKKHLEEVSRDEIRERLGVGYDSLVAKEKRLYVLGDSIVDSWNEFGRMDALTDFIPRFVQALKIPGSFTYPFDSFSFMYIIKSPDEKFRLYSWALRFDDGTYRYYGALHFKDEEGASQLLPLYDKSKDIMYDAVEDTILHHENWYGALYYDILKIKHKRKDYYILLGWDGNNYRSSKKIIDVFSFDENNELQIGAPLFERGDTYKMRRVFEFNKEYTMVLKADEKSKMIVFDRLVAPKEKDAGKPWLYVPSDMYDYYHFKKGKWHFHEDLYGEIDAGKANQLLDKGHKGGDRFNLNGEKM